MRVVTSWPISNHTIKAVIGRYLAVLQGHYAIVYRNGGRGQLPVSQFRRHLRHFQAVKPIGFCVELGAKEVPPKAPGESDQRWIGHSPMNIIDGAVRQDRAGELRRALHRVAVTD